MSTKTMKVGLALSLALTLGVRASVKAEDAPAGPKVSFSGGLDTYYQFNGASTESHSTGGAVGTAPQSVGPSGRAFDTADSTFKVGLAKFGIDAKEGKASGHIDLMYGQDADIITSGGGGTAIAVENAVVNYTPDAKWTFTMGKFATPIGFEVIESWANLNYSRSYLYWDTIPVVHSGVKASYAISDKYSATLMIANSGWADEVSTSLHKDALVQFIGNPSPKFGFVGTILVGNKSGAVHTEKDVADVDLNFNPTSKLYLGLDLTAGQATAPDFFGAGEDKTDVMPYTGLALYASYAFSDAWKLGMRLERLNDQDGAAGAGASKVQEGTLTLAYKVGNFLPRLEYRYDEAFNTVGTTDVRAEIFSNPEHPGGVVSSQRTLTLSTAYTF